MVSVVVSGVDLVDVEVSKEEEVASVAAEVVLLVVLMRVHSHNKTILTVVLQKLSPTPAPLPSAPAFQTRRLVPAPAQAVHQLALPVSEAVPAPNNLVKQPRTEMALVHTPRLSDS